MSPVNYHLELPMQWSIHPVFHIDLLMPYCKTITHGPNYQRPPPDLVDNEEEYEVEAILDSQLFRQHKRLQYLVKWKGYPDSDNMWVDKDDIFVEDKVQEFKASNPNVRAHVSYIGDDGKPQFPLAPSSPSSTSSYFAPHILSMSDNASNTAYEPHLSAHKSRPPSPDNMQSRPSGASNATEITATFSQMSIGPPPIPTTESDKPEGLVTLSVPTAKLLRDADSPVMEA